MERATWLTQDDLPLYEVAVFADAQLPTEFHCNFVRAFLYMGWLHQPNQHEPVPKRSGKSSRFLGSGLDISAICEGSVIVYSYIRLVIKSQEQI